MENDKILLVEGNETEKLILPAPIDKLRKYKKIFIAVIIILVLTLGIVIPVSIYATSNRPKNLIIMISDGCGPASFTFARETSGQSLFLDTVLAGTVQTSSSSSFITDSASGATAYSCALRTYNAAIAVDDNQKPCGTIMEAAKSIGMKTGLVATSRITHATPAAFSAHVIDRDMEAYIAQQQVERSTADVMFGGGLNFFTSRADGVNLFNVANSKGYQTITTRAEFDGPLNFPVIGLFAPSHMSYEIDRNPAVEPSLSEMTQKALDLLNANSENGFLLMVEGSRIDMAAHSNDPGAHYHDIIAYDNTAKVIMDFVANNPHTTVISVSDHETGGLSLGRNFRNYTYPVYEWYPRVVLNQKMSCESMGKLIQGGSSIVDVLASQASITDLTQDEINAMQNISSNLSILADLIGEAISYRALVGWTTWGHTGVDINLYSFGERSGTFKGNYRNDQVGGMLASMFNLDLQSITNSLKDLSPIPPSYSQTKQESKPANRYHG